MPQTAPVSTTAEALEEHERAPGAPAEEEIYMLNLVLGKGQMGSALLGSLHISCFTFPKVPGRTFFSAICQSSLVTLAAAPLTWP